MKEIPFILKIRKSGGSYIIVLDAKLVHKFKIQDEDFFLPFIEDDDNPNRKNKSNLSLKLKRKSDLKDLPFIYFTGEDDV